MCNPTKKESKLRKKFAIALPAEHPGPVSDPFYAELGPYQALEIDCPDIRKHVRFDADLIKGFVIIESPDQLEVVAVYTASGKDDTIETLDTERVQPRRLALG